MKSIASTNDIPSSQGYECSKEECDSCHACVVENFYRKDIIFSDIKKHTKKRDERYFYLCNNPKMKEFLYNSYDYFIMILKQYQHKYYSGKAKSKKEEDFVISKIELMEKLTTDDDIAKLTNKINIQKAELKKCQENMLTNSEKRDRLFRNNSSTINTFQEDDWNLNEEHKAPHKAKNRKGKKM